ncbi:c-type cytochrome biogenesis protein CcmI [Pontivivens ytuae]|uniref:c-type cytochrome biogenesis protein CcmI n=1 Tax=Pontivivens ytuae TaxID=2789856 RepID=UPI001E3A22D2|nr:c-type cytochrome biogenesis protein CcmI [Pontivivens ytuae]
MLFWIIALLIGLIVVLALLRPLLRLQEEEGEASDVAVYRDQLATLDADVARGVVAPEEAETTRVELSRRLLAAADAAERADAARAAPLAGTRMIASFSTAFVLVGGTAIYLWLGAPGRPDAPLASRAGEAQAIAEMAQRPPQAIAEAMVAARTPEPEVSERDRALLTQLETVLEGRPDDAEGLRLLARTYMQLGYHLEGRQAQDRLVALLGAEARTEDLSALAEFMIIAAGGYVSPEAEAVLDDTLARDPGEPWAAYYKARAEVQAGDRAGAEARLTDLVENPTTPEALRAAAADDLARLSAPGPDANAVAAAQDLDPEAQREMIEGMVGGLAARLAEDGGTVAEWQRLIRAYRVLGEAEAAEQAMADARDAFAGDAAALDELEATQ